MFIDEATVRVRGGRGGSGVIHFISSRMNLRGGPDGGNGGTGGSVILRASSSINTLFSFRNQPKFAGDDGINGGRNTCHGARGQDRLVQVPVGTVVRNAEDQAIIADLACPGDEVCVAEGGKGGRGNSSFTTSRRQAPRICERGLSGEEHTLLLELRLIADVGIIGYPNVGKSSLISTISRKRAKVANYPFTTIVPNLGVVDAGNNRSFVAVDVPGLIEGAHLGKGLGDRFLRHVQRTRLFIHMVDVASLEERDPVDDYIAIRNELKSFHPNLAERPEMVVGNKIDLVDDAAVEDLRARFREIGVELHPVSVATMTGIRKLVMGTYRLLEIEKERDVISPTVVRRKVYRYEGETGFVVTRDEGGFTVTGRTVENLVRQLVLDSQDALEYLASRLEKMGVLKELRRQGFQSSEVVHIGGVDLELEG